MRSNLPKPALASSLIGVVALTWLACAVYTLRLNPEVALWRDAVTIKQAWAKQMEAEHGPKTLIYGGSSCAFSIDGERLWNKHQLPVVNMGLGAAMGPGLITQVAISAAKPGDTLVVALEPGMFTGPLGEPSLAEQFSLAMHSPHWLDEPWAGRSGSWFSAVLALRPGGYHFFTMLGKLVKRAPMFRYSRSDIHPSGWMTTAVRGSLGQPPGHGPQITQEAQDFVRWLRHWGEQNHVRVAYAIPWGHAEADQAPEFQRSNILFLEQMSHLLPVLKDPRLGVCTNRQYFADTGWHLSPEGSAVRTDEFAEQVKSWQMWTGDELAALSTKQSGYVAAPSATTSRAGGM